MATPASIRFFNPGAQYPGPSAQKFGSTGTEIIGGGHKIAVFDDPVKGAAAQFDLLKRGYAGMPLLDAIAKWSGGNSSAAYAAKVAEATGLAPNAVLTSDMLANPAVAVPLARTMASWEAGQPYPMSDEQWTAAHGMAFGTRDPRNVAPSGGGYGVDPDGAAGVSGSIHTSAPRDAGVATPPRDVGAGAVPSAPAPTGSMLAGLFDGGPLAGLGGLLGQGQQTNAQLARQGAQRASQAAQQGQSSFGSGPIMQAIQRRLSV